MLVSVLMCSNKSDAFMYEALDSILGQSYSRFEIVLILNGEALSAAREIRSKIHDDRIRVFEFWGMGLLAALNFGLSHCAGPLVARMDADDISDPQRLEKQVECFRTDPRLGVLGSSLLLIDGGGRVVGRKCYPNSDSAIRRKLTLTNPFAHPSVMYRKQCIDHAGGYGGLPHVEDLDLWLKLAAAFPSAEMTFGNLDAPLVRYRAGVVGANRKRPLTFTAVALELAYFGVRCRNPLFFVGAVVNVARAIGAAAFGG